MNRKGQKTRTIEWLIFGVLALIVAQQLNWLPIGMFGAEAAPEEAAAQVGAFCAIEDTTYTFTEEDKYNAGTALSDSGTTNDAFAIFVNGVRKDGVYASGDSVTLSPGDNVVITLYDYAEDNALDNVNTFQKTFTVPCRGTLDQTLQALDLTALTFQLYDNTYTDASQDGNAWAVDVGGSETGTVRIVSTIEEAFGSPDGKLCLVAYGNKSEYKDIVMAGEKIVEVSCKPDGFAMENLDDEYWSWELDPFEGAETREYSFSLTMEGSPAQAGAFGINLTIFDEQYFLNKDTGKLELGYEDEDDNLVGAANVVDAYLFS